MLYIIKSIYSFLLPPGVFIILLTGLAFWLVRRERKAGIFLAVTVFGFYICSVPLFGELLIRSLETTYDPQAVSNGDILIVLGGGATLDTPDIDGQGQLSGAGANRLLTALRIHRKTDLPILLSSGQVYSDSGNESLIAKRQLIGMGVPDSKIILENTSLNTDQNARNVKQVLGKFDFKQPVLITSAFHMPRAVKSFAKYGITVKPFPTDYRVSRDMDFRFRKLIPSYGAVSQTGTALKEYLGLAALYI